MAFILVIPGSQPNELARAFQGYGTVREAYQPEDFQQIIQEQGIPSVLVISSTLPNLTSNVQKFRQMFQGTYIVVVGKVTPSQLRDMPADDVVAWPLPANFQLMGNQAELNEDWGIGSALPVAPASRSIERPTKPYSEEVTLPSGKDRVIVVGSGKGGDGKTTIAMQLAMLAAKQKIPVLVIDADYTGLASTWITNHEPVHSILELEKENVWDRSMLEDLLISGHGIKMLPAPPSGQKPVTPQLLERTIQLYRRYFSVIIVDMHQGYEPLLRHAKNYASHIFVVTTPSERRLGGCVSLVRQLVEDKTDRKKINVVVNRSHGEESMQRVRVALEDYPGIHFYDLPFDEDLERDDDLDFAPALKGGSGTYSKDFRSIAKKGAELEIKGPEKASEDTGDTSNGKFSFFTRLFGSNKSSGKTFSKSSGKKKGGKKR